jgi:hypothetical protein
MQCVENCDDPDPKRHLLYEQPVWQTLQMFRTCPTHSSSPYPAYTFVRSWRNALYVLPSCLPLSQTDGCCPGFLPVLFTALSARWRSLSTPSIRLPDEPSDDDLDGLSESQKLPAERLTGWRILLLWLPALCDLTGTTVRAFLPLRALSYSHMHTCDWALQLMNVGLLYTPVSIYQMTRGALVLFVGILSVLFLHRRLYLYQ